MVAFENRFKILLEGGLVSSESIRITEELVDLINQHYHIELDESTGAALVTHLAVTFKKLLKQEQLDEIPEVCKKEAYSFKEEMEFAHELADYIQTAYQIDFNASEIAFLAVHLRNVNKNRQ